MTSGNWFVRERGGAPNWLLLASIIAVLVLGIIGFSGAGGEEQPDWEPPAGWTPEVAQPQDWPVAVFIGDSYTAGAGGDGVRWTTGVAAEQEWIEVNLGRGGTRYVATSGPEGCGLDYCPSYPEMISDAAEREPEIVVVSGGRNDATQQDADAIRTTFESLRDALPNARIIAVSPMWDHTPYPEQLVEMGDAIRTAVQAVGGEYLEIGSPLAGRPEMVTEDGVHPTADGYRVLGDAVSAALRG